MYSSPHVWELMDDPSRQESPPRRIRRVFYEYRFATPGTRRDTGRWWTQKRLGVLDAGYL